MWRISLSYFSRRSTDSAASHQSSHPRRFSSGFAPPPREKTFAFAPRSSGETRLQRKKRKKMERASGVKKEKEPASSVQDASDRITRRGETIDDKIKKLDAELSRYKEQIKRMRPGQAQEAKKARAMRILKQKQTYEGQRDMLCNESFKLDQVAFAMEGIKDKDAQQTRRKTHNSGQCNRSFMCTLFGTCLPTS